MKGLFFAFAHVPCLVGVASGFNTPSPHHRRRLPSPKPAQRKGATDLQYAPLPVVDDFLFHSPYAAAALVCGIKASAADAVAQFQEWKESMVKQEQEQQVDASRKEEEPSSWADVKRNVAFVAYGSLYQGLTQEYIYNHLYPVWFGTGADWTVVLSKVAFSLLIQTTLLTLPSLYLIKGIIEQTSFLDAMKKYISDIKNQQLLQKFYALWGPVLTITFSVVPEQWRVTFIAFVSFFWLIILSGISNNMSPAEKDRLCAVGQDFCEFDYDD
ncbi:hypothetical protein ACHAWF_013687 [Thalassiosira exigua]